MPPRRRSPAYRLLRGAGLLFVGWLAAMAAAVIAMRGIDPPTTAFMLRGRFDAFAAGGAGGAGVASDGRRCPGVSAARWVRLHADRPRARRPRARAPDARCKHHHAAG